MAGNPGDPDLARQNYARALEVQPDYPNAVAARQILAKGLRAEGVPSP